jgi:LmbE family N-acetylglucosaminyl deacetylase
MSPACDNPGKVLVLVAHPDDETIACSGLLQRATKALVVFAVDGAPPHYGFEKKFGSLQKYSAIRFQEVERVLAFIPHCSSRRLARPDGASFVDQHLFQDLPAAFTCLLQFTRAFSPDFIVSHAFEGGHIDHDACHVLAQHAAHALGVRCLEFPLYWRTKDAKDVFQQFRQSNKYEFTLQLSCQELLIKQRMLAEYQSQANLTSVFRADLERFRPVLNEPLPCTAWTRYPFENRHRQLKAKLFFEKVTEFLRSTDAVSA